VQQQQSREDQQWLQQEETNLNKRLSLSMGPSAELLPSYSQPLDTVTTGEGHITKLPGVVLVVLTNTWK
jgi:hypothetical protein